MFFLVTIIFLIQLIVMGIIISYLINLNMKILHTKALIQSFNTWILSRSTKIETIFSDILSIISLYEKKLKSKQQMLILKQTIGLLEWIFIIILKNKGKKLLLSYKLIKALSGELSTIKNMV